MVFGLTQWLISFIIFLIVLSIITWSAVHLGKKDQNFTDYSHVRFRFFDIHEHSSQRENSTSRVIASTDGLALFANDQGSEIPDSAEFYNFIMKTKNGIANSMEDNIATTIFTPSVIDNHTTWSEDVAITILASSVISNDTTWNEDAAITIFTPSVINNDTRKKDIMTAVYNASDESLLLLNIQNISKKL